MCYVVCCVVSEEG